MNKDKAYHQIALACLKTLRTPTNASAQDPTAALFKSIDEAFSAQYDLLLTELADYQARLNAIAALDPTQHKLADAQAIATAKTQHH